MNVRGRTMSDTLSSAVPVEVTIETEDVKPVLGCRGCLVSDQPLRRLDDQLAEAYGLLISTVAKYDLYPKYICTYCRALLLRFMSFRKKCLFTQNALRYINSMGAQIPLDEIKSGFNISPYPLQVTETLLISLVDKKSTPNQNVDTSIPNQNVDANTSSSIRQNMLEIEPLNSRIDNAATGDILIKSYTKIEPKVVPDPTGLDDMIALDNINDFVSDDHTSEDCSTDDSQDAERFRNINNVIYNNGPLNPQTANNQDEIDEDRKKYLESDNSNNVGSTNVTRVYDDSIKNLNAHTSLARATPTRLKRKLQNEISTYKEGIPKSHEDLNVTNLKAWIAKIQSERRMLGISATQNVFAESSDLGIHEIRKRMETVKAKQITDEINKIEMLQIEELERKIDVKLVTLTKEQQIQQYDHIKDSKQYKKAKFKCEICSFGCIRKFTLENHMLRHKLIEGHVLCEICKKSFPTTRTKINNTNIRAHINANHKYNYICNQCGQVSKTREAATRHCTEHKGVQYDCNVCGKKFNKYTSVVGHMHLSHKDILIPCSICGHMCVSEKGLHYHIRRSHKEAIGAVCTSCGMQFHSVAALQRHLQIQDVHSDHTLRPCTACGMSFASDSHLQEHESTCESKKEYICDRNCDKRFKDLGSYYKHVHFECAQVSKRIKRNKIKMEKLKIKRERRMCEICGKSVSYGMLDLHLRRDHTRETKFKCDYCGKGFFDKPAMIRHINKHIGRRAAPFPCRHCDQPFAKYSGRTRHEQVIHEGLRPYSCDICGATFKRKNVKLNHMRLTHEHGCENVARTREK